ncbi:ATP-binding protein [Novosphingobium sp. PP1Y]|uniref:ATP-binding protein n=1 Tax=Novosphingobium sp. PP1Y TaxID=702113 RepID=UPI001314E885|nr:ATP-binding protein [Novosphingobium sp. PP1Y]
MTGISGVGKTTFIRKLAEKMSFQHLTGGSLIARAQAGRAISRDALRQFDLDENQRLLVEGFMVARDRSAEMVVFDGHTVIDGPAGLATIPVDVFEALGLCLVVHLEAEPAVIQRNRKQDSRRERPSLNLDVLRNHQIYSRRHAMAIAQALGVDCLVIQAEEISKLEACLTS